MQFLPLIEDSQDAEAPFFQPVTKGPLQTRRNLSTAPQHRSDDPAPGADPRGSPPLSRLSASISPAPGRMRSHDSAPSPGKHPEKDLPTAPTPLL